MRKFEYIVTYLAGTAEELLECITWSQIRIHSKPVLILNVNGFYDPLVMKLFNYYIITLADPMDGQCSPRRIC